MRVQKLSQTERDALDGYAAVEIIAGTTQTILPRAENYYEIGCGDDTTVIRWEQGKYHAAILTSAHGGLELSQHATEDLAYAAVAKACIEDCTCGCAGVVSRRQ